MRFNSIRTHVFLLVTMVSVPFALIVAWRIYADMQQSVANTKNSQRILATVTAGNADEIMGGARAVLERLATRPLIKRVDPRQ